MVETVKDRFAVLMDKSRLYAAEFWKQIKQAIPSLML
jgi:hypothetical protein